MQDKNVLFIPLIVLGLVTMSLQLYGFFTARPGQLQEEGWSMLFMNLLIGLGAAALTGVIVFFTQKK
jgi:hypothetical protein